MKKIVLFSLVICIMSQLKSQGDCYRERGGSIYDVDTGCLRVLPTDIYDTAPNGAEQRPLTCGTFPPASICCA